MDQQAIEKSKSQAKAEPRLVDLETTYVLIPDGEVESRICHAFIEKKYGENIKAQVVTAVPLVRLRPGDALLIVARSKLTPITRKRESATMAPEWYPVELDELINDVRERPPLRVDDFWIRGGVIGGQVDTTALIVAINQLTSPFYVRHRADEGLIRLFYF